MNKIQEDTLNMYQATDDVLQNHNGTWVANVPFKAAVKNLEDNIAEIEDLRDRQETDITGVAEDKANKRKDLVDKTYQAGSILVFFASSTNNRKLLNKVNFTRTALEQARDNELPGMAKQVQTEAVANAVAVLPFGLTALMASDLDTAINDYVDQISKPRSAQTETSAATEQLDTVYTDTDKLLLEQLDKGMELFVSDADFYSQYNKARIIVNSPVQKRALDVHFEDSVTHAAIAHVIVVIDDTVHKRSSSLGNIRMQSMAEGAHVLKAQLPGYADASQNFNIVSGETTKITIAMVRV